MSCQRVPGATAGLGFSHLPPSGATAGTSDTTASMRGQPRGATAESFEQCCRLCLVLEGCRAFLFRGQRCFLGACSAGGTACLELGGAMVGVVGGVTLAAAPPALVCSHPPTAPGGGRAGRLGRVGADDVGAGNAGRVALLQLGQRSRLMFETVPQRLVAPLVRAGFDVQYFALLENSSLARAFRGRRPLGSPSLLALDDVALTNSLSEAIGRAGGRIGRIWIGPRPRATLPSSRGLAGRLSRYSAAVQRTVATRLLKEKIGFGLVTTAEAASGDMFAWVLCLREDPHWFSPLRLGELDPTAVHGKACGGFGGWNDKVWIMPRRWAGVMLGMYDDLLRPVPQLCRNALPPGVKIEADSVSVDFLDAPSVEQFRQRVGLLHRVPYQKRPPADIPTMDSYYARDGSRVTTALAEGEREAVDAAVGGWRLCFPHIYARGCVPPANQSWVDAHLCQ